MKKIFKTLIALILAAVFAMSSMSAFAADSNGTITWQIYADEKTEFVYAGVLSEGKNTVQNSNANEYFYFVFEAEKNGYYFINFNRGQIGGVHIPEKVENSDCKGAKDGEYLYFYLEDTYRDQVLYYFEEGTHIICAERGYADYKETDIFIEYAGAEITGLDFEGGVKYDLIPEYNINEKSYDNGVYTYNFYPCITKLSFDSGRVYDVVVYDLCFETETEVTEGKYDITVDFLGKTFDKTISVYDITHTVKSIEVKNFENYDTVTEYFDGCLGYDMTGLEITVEFADGREETIKTGGTGMMGLDLQNGNPAYIYLTYGYCTDDDGNVYFVLKLAEHEYVNLPVEKIDATKLENSKHMTEENFETVKDEVSWLRWDLEYLFEKDSELKAEALRDLVCDLFYALPNIMREVFERFNAFFAF